MSPVFLYVYVRTSRPPQPHDPPLQTEMQICLWCLLSTIYRPLLVANRTRGIIECFQNECWSSKPNDPPLLAIFVSFIYLLQSSFSLGVHNSWCFGNDAVNDNWNVYLFIFNTFVIVKEEYLWARWKEILSPYAVKPWLDVPLFFLSKPQTSCSLYQLYCTRTWTFCWRKLQVPEKGLFFCVVDVVCNTYFGSCRLFCRHIMTVMSIDKCTTLAWEC